MIDSHLHQWQLARGWYGWNTPDLGPLHADAVLADLDDEWAASGIDSVVLVQAADTLAETDWLLSIAREDRRVAGVVGYLPLSDPGRLRDLLVAYADTALVGVRQLWHDHPRPDALAGPDVLTALRLLAEAGLAVDVPDAFPRLWPALSTAVRTAPQTTFVLDHCGKPPFGDRGAWTGWEADFARLVRNPNVVVKLSGLFGGSGSTSPATDAELDRVVDLALDLAGPRRTMIGSDWPMTRGTLGYAATIQRLTALLSRLTRDELAAVTAGTARTVYGLDAAG